MGAWVVDASVAIKWLIDEPGTPQAIALRRHTLFAPDLLLAECAGILRKKVRRDELAGDEAVVCARLSARAEVELIPARGLLDRAMRLAIRLDHPAYDCMSLGLAHGRRQAIRHRGWQAAAPACRRTPDGHPGDRPDGVCRVTARLRPYGRLKNASAALRCPCLRSISASTRAISSRNSPI